jgi:hypothetical protein
LTEHSERFRLYGIKDLHRTLSGQAKNVSTIAQELSKIIHGLRHQKKLKDFKGSLYAVAGAMELVKNDREIFLGGLFSGTPDPLEVIKKKELHGLLEDAIERSAHGSRRIFDPSEDFPPRRRRPQRLGW